MNVPSPLLGQSTQINPQITQTGWSKTNQPWSIVIHHLVRFMVYSGHLTEAKPARTQSLQPLWCFWTYTYLLCIFLCIWNCMITYITNCIYLLRNAGLSKNFHGQGTLHKRFAPCKRHVGEVQRRFLVFPLENLDTKVHYSKPNPLLCVDKWLTKLREKCIKLTFL